MHHCMPLRPGKGRLIAERGAPPRKARVKIQRADWHAALHASAPRQGATYSGAQGAPRKTRVKIQRADRHASLHASAPRQWAAYGGAQGAASLRGTLSATHVLPERSAFQYSRTPCEVRFPLLTYFLRGPLSTNAALFRVWLNFSHFFRNAGESFHWIVKVKLLPVNFVRP